MFHPADCSPIARGLTHMTIAAGGAGHALVRLLFGRCEITPADVIVFRLDAFIRNHLLDLRPSRCVHELIMDGIGSDPPLTDCMGNQPEPCGISDGKYFDIGCLSYLIDRNPPPFGVDARRQKIEYRDIPDGHDHDISVQ